MTCKITPEEIKANRTIGPILNADIQVMQNGMWNPLAPPVMKDAWSLGIGFTSVKASF
jgi:hypothetical protein